MTQKTVTKKIVESVFPKKSYLSEENSFAANQFRYGDQKAAVGDGSRQISPNHAEDVHVCSVVDELVGSWVGPGVIGNPVVMVVVDSSRQPQKRPGDSQLVEVREEGSDAGVVVGSRQPNHPGVLQDVVVEVGAGEVVGAAVVVIDGAGVACAVVDVVVWSLHPNQPGVLQVVVVLELVVELLVDVAEVVVIVVVVELPDEVVPVVVVVSSKQPHQPGVSQVVVLVLVEDVVVEVVVVVVISEPLLLKNAQRLQS